MKKLLLVIFGILVLAGFIKPASAQSIGFRLEPSSGGKVGETIKIYVEVTHPPTGSKAISLYISSTVTRNIEEATPYLKDRWTDIPDPGATKTYLYEWDTKAAGSTSGLHYINVFITDASNYVLLNQTTQYTLVAAEGTNTDDQESTENDRDNDESEKSVEGFNLGKLGTISFLPTKINDAKELITVIINWLLSLLGALAVVAIVYSGIMYITAGSDTAKSENAKKNLTWAIIGIVVIMVSFVLVTIVNQIILGK